MNTRIAYIVGSAALAILGFQAGAAAAPIAAAGRQDSPSIAISSKADAAKDAKVQHGAALDKCKGLQGDEKKHCKVEAARTARAVYKEQTDRASTPLK